VSQSDLVHKGLKISVQIFLEKINASGSKYFSLNPLEI
jgi:hypothetical protein